MIGKKIGIISDTHLSYPNEVFKEIVDRCFRNVEIIMHAGDLTNLSILSVFKNKQVHAVHGNMCRPSVLKTLPAKKEVVVGGTRIGLVHKVGHSYDFEDRLVEVFPEADCIIYGHTHSPVCHKAGKVLYINPGSFNSRGTYAILEIGESLTARICQVYEGQSGKAVNWG